MILLQPAALLQIDIALQTQCRLKQSKCGPENLVRRRQQLVPLHRHLRAIMCVLKRRAICLLNRHAESGLARRMIGERSYRSQPGQKFMNNAAPLALRIRETGQPLPPKWIF